MALLKTLTDRALCVVTRHLQQALCSLAFTLDMLISSPLSETIVCSEFNAKKQKEILCNKCCRRLCKLSSPQRISTYQLSKAFLQWVLNGFSGGVVRQIHHYHHHHDHNHRSRHPNNHTSSTSSILSGRGGVQPIRRPQPFPLRRRLGHPWTFHHRSLSFLSNS